MNYRQFWYALAMPSGLLVLVATYGWATDSIKYGGVVALIFAAATGWILKQAFADADPRKVVSHSETKSNKWNRPVTDSSFVDLHKDPGNMFNDVRHPIPTHYVQTYVLDTHIDNHQ